jgi:hypothetical protein
VGAPIDDPAPSELEQRATTIVLLGRFNPRIFQPMWFASRKLLAEHDVEPESVVVTDGLSAFRRRDISLFCAQDRCQFGSTPTTPTPDILRDLATETFTVLRETPIRQIGINHNTHVPSTVRDWDTIAAQMGDPHRRFVLLEDQQLQTVQFGGPRDDGLNGSRMVLLQPSVVLEGGVFFQVNDHVELVDSPDIEPLGASGAVDALNAIWDSSRVLSDQIQREIAPRR